MKTKKPIAVIVGGKGNEGKRWAGVLLSDGWDVRIIDKGDKTNILSKSQLVVLATPWRAVGPEIAKTLFRISPGSLFISVMGRMKSQVFIVGQNRHERDICEELQKRGVDISLVHCMCASTMPLAGQNVAVHFLLCSALHRKWLTDLLRRNDAKVVGLTREHHDKVAKFVQKALRDLAVSFAVAAFKEGVTFAQMYALASPPARAFLAGIARFLLQPAELNELIMLDLDGAPRIMSTILELSNIHMIRQRNFDGDLESASKDIRSILNEARKFVDNDLARQLAASLT